MEPSGHPSDRYFTDFAAAELSELMVDFKPEVVALEGLWLHRYIELFKFYPCQIILDCHNIEATLSRELSDTARGNGLEKKILTKILPERVRKIEQAATAQVDQAWVCSSRDAALMKSLYSPPVPVHVVPNGIDLGYYELSTTLQNCKIPATAESLSILFPAMFAYPPNRKAANFLIADLFPRLVDAFPQGEVVLACNWPTNEMLEASRKEPVSL